MSTSTGLHLQRTCDDGDSYITAIKANNFKIGKGVLEFMNKDAFADGFNITDVYLGFAKVKELTGKKKATLGEIFEAIRKVNGDLLPAWVGLELCKHHPDYLDGKTLVTAMEPVVTEVSGDYAEPCVLGIAGIDGGLPSGGREVILYRGDSDCLYEDWFYGNDRYFVFRRLVANN